VQAAVAAAHAPSPARQLVAALIDTGARESCIDDALAKELQLPLIDQADGSGIGGTNKFDLYLGHIRIAALNVLEWGRFWA
jgi:Aspartyl protease